MTENIPNRWIFILTGVWEQAMEFCFKTKANCMQTEKYRLSYVWSKSAEMESLRANQYPQIIILHFFLWQSKWENWGQEGFAAILVGNVINTCILSYKIESHPVNSCCCTFQHIVSKNLHWQQFFYAVEMVEKNLEDIYPRYFTASNQAHPVLESCRSKTD